MCTTELEGGSSAKGKAPRALYDILLCLRHFHCAGDGENLQTSKKVNGSMNLPVKSVYEYKKTSVCVHVCVRRL